MQKKILPYLLISLLACTVYFQNLWFDFAYLDDNLIVFEEFEKINSLTKIPAAFTGGYLYDNYYRPMIMISFIIDTAIAGQSSAMYHLMNLLIHIIVSILAYLFLIKITKEKFLSLLFALLFSIHPLNVNAVSWIAGRNDLLAALFSLLSVLSFIKYWEGDGNKYLYLFSVSYIFAMFSKEIGVLIPVVIIFYILLVKPPPSITFQLTRIRENGRRFLNEISPLLIASVVPAAIYFLLRFFLSPVTVREEMSITSFFQNINIPFEYIAKVFYFFEFYPLSMTNITLVILGCLISLILLVVLIINKKTDYRKFFFGLVLFLLFVLPAVFVRVPASDGGFNYIDCRAYLPLIGFFIMLISIISAYSEEKRYAGFLKSGISTAVIVIVFLYTLTFSAIENQYYKNGEVFWSRLTEIYPERATYWMGLGFYYYDNKDFIKAAAYAERAIKLKPYIDEFYQKGALAYTNAGDYHNAIRLLENGLSLGESEKQYKLSRNKSHIYLDLIKSYLAVGSLPDAEKYSEQILAIEKSGNSNKEKADLIYASANYFYNANHLTQSMNLIKEAIVLYPAESKYYNLLGAILFRGGEKDLAKMCFMKALEINPDDTDAYSNLQKLQSLD